jgi:hypothetical protein
MEILYVEVITGLYPTHELDKYFGYSTHSQIKGKTIHVQPWTGRGGSRSLRLPDFKTIGT